MCIIKMFSSPNGGFPCGSDGKESVCNVGSLGQEDRLEKEMATHSSILQCLQDTPVFLGKFHGQRRLVG